MSGIAIGHRFQSSTALKASKASPLGQRLSRNALIPPAFADLAASLQYSLLTASMRLRYFMPMDRSQLIEASDERFATLYDPLSNDFIARHGEVLWKPRSNVEASVLDRFIERRSTRQAEVPNGMMADLVFANSELTNGKAAVRRNTMLTNKDTEGCAVEFPSPKTFHAQIELIDRLDQQFDRRRGVYTAAVAMIIITNAHGFTDGNGRLSRMIFNYFLRRGGLPQTAYIPVHELASCSRGGFLLAVRRVEIQGNWTLYFQYILELLQVVDISGRFGCGADHG